MARFPRLRGDRPYSGPCGGLFDEVPPPTRGSTRWMYEGSTGVPGSPAYAGIDLTITASTLRPCGFPRLRGDRPQTAEPRSSERSVPPPTRGSTLIRDARHSLFLGSPAYAGIDPIILPPEKTTRRFPRLRGDRPVLVMQNYLSTVVPPPTRGSTPVPRIAEGTGEGSPAYAGIDLPPALARLCVRRFPRLRGDRPQIDGAGNAVPQVPPPTRGSTWRAYLIRLAPCGSPAYAGIDPTRPRYHASA